MPSLLEVCSGTGSMGRAFRALGWEVTSLDFDPKSGADIIADVCEWQPPEGAHWDAIWCSPPCTEFSVALTTRPRRLEEGLRVARRCLELIEQLKPTLWWMENPGSGLLPKQEGFMDLPCKLLTYCKYESPQHAYRKLTWVATNCDAWQPRPCCRKSAPCQFIHDGRHENCAQRGPMRLRSGALHGKACSLKQLYSMPPALCHEIAQAATQVICGTN